MTASSARPPASPPARVTPHPVCVGVTLLQGRSHFFSRLIHGYSPDPVLVSRFHCEDAGCGAVIDEVQLAGRCAAAGVRLSLAVPKGDTAVLGRLLLKADTATISIPELEFEISPNSSMPFEGVLTTVGSCLRTACDNLSADQEQRQAADPETASRIGAFIQVGWAWRRQRGCWVRAAAAVWPARATVAGLPRCSAPGGVAA